MNDLRGCRSIWIIVVSVISTHPLQVLFWVTSDLHQTLTLGFQSCRSHQLRSKTRKFRYLMNTRTRILTRRGKWSISSQRRPSQTPQTRCRIIAGIWRNLLILQPVKKKKRENIFCFCVRFIFYVRGVTIYLAHNWKQSTIPSSRLR